VVKAARGSGEISLKGAAARLGQPGDLVIIATYCWLDDESAKKYEPTVVAVVSNNHIVRD